MKRRVLFLFIMMLLSACKQEPIIKLSSDVQSSIEKKKAEQQQVEEQSNTATSSVELVNQVTIDTSGWQKLDENAELDIIDYAPNGTNQLKQFIFGEEYRTVYTDYADAAKNMLQVRTIMENGQYNVAVYRLLNNQWQLIEEHLNTKDTLNHIDTSVTIPNQRTTTMLVAPVKLGTTWEKEANVTSQITALYKEAVIENEQYQDVVEVSTIYSDYEEKLYYAKQEGIILISHIPIDSTGKESQWCIKRNEKSVSITHNIEISVPNTQENPKLIPSKVGLTWQTNQSPVQSWTLLCREQGWLTDKVEIKNITLQSDTIVVDFSPGIVAAMNQNKATEEKLIPAIVQTFGDYYGVKKVKLTVNGLILSPDKLQVPAEGIWHIDDTWLN